MLLHIISLLSSHFLSPSNGISKRALVESRYLEATPKIAHTAESGRPSVASTSSNAEQQSPGKVDWSSP